MGMVRAARWAWGIWKGRKEGWWRWRRWRVKFRSLRVKRKGTDENGSGSGNREDGERTPLLNDEENVAAQHG
jgi:hypothetical protein